MLLQSSRPALGEPASGVVEKDESVTEYRPAAADTGVRHARLFAAFTDHLDAIVYIFAYLFYLSIFPNHPLPSSMAVGYEQQQQQQQQH